MRWRVLIVAAVVVQVLSAARLAALPGEDPGVDADVDVYFIDRVGMTRPMQEAVHTELVSIYAKAGVKLSWHVVGRDPDHEVRPERLIRVVLGWRRMLAVPVTRNRRNRITLGATWISDHGTYFSRSVLLPYEDIARVAMEAQPSGTTGSSFIASPASIAAPGIQHVMARVIAHEMGHILLNRQAHSAHGIMRPDFSYSELTTPGDEEFCFSTQEEEQLRYAARHAKEETPGEEN